MACSKVVSMKRLTYVLLAVVAAVVFTISPATSAAEYGGVGGRPANPRSDNPRTQSIFVYTLKGGKQVSDGIKVYNNTSTDRTVSIYAVDSVLASGGAFSCAQQVEQKRDVGNWIKLDTNSVSLKPNSNTIVPFTVTAPSKASAGEHDGCITIQDDSTTNSSEKQGGVVLSFRSAIRVAVTIPGAIVKNLQLESVTVTQAKNGNYIVSPLVHNGGNVSLDTDITAGLQSLFGSKLVSTRQTYPVLPNSRSSWNFELKRPFWGGWYRGSTSVSYASDPLSSLGHKSDQQKTISLQSKIFFATPKPVAMVVELAVLLAVVAIVYRYYRSFRSKRHVRHHWKVYRAKKSDTIENVAAKYGTTWKKIAKANKLKPPYNLQEGQALKVPPEKTTE